MHKNRMEAFSDGVFAIIITIMVLELKVPHGVEWADLFRLLPVFLSYVFSFIYVGIYWNNHHHLLHPVKRISGAALWANMHLLFWLSLTPFVTAWIGENYMAPWPVACYGFVLMMNGVAYYILTRILIAQECEESELGKAVGKDIKGILSVVFYAIAIGVSFYFPAISIILYGLVAIMWIVPDKRIESRA